MAQPADVGAIEPRGRNGTFVRPPTGPGGRAAYRRVTEGPGHFALDLSSGTPDPGAAPDLAPIVARVSRQSLTSSYLDHPVLPDAGGGLEASWPFPPESLTVVDGAMDALDRVARSCSGSATGWSSSTRRSRRSSTCSTSWAARSIGVDLDDEGIAADGLAARLAARPPRCSCSPARRTRPGSALAARPGRGARRLLAGTHHDRDRGRPRRRHLDRAAVSLGTWLPADRARPQLLEEPRPRPAPRRRRRRGDLVDGGRQPPAARAGLVSRILQALLLELLATPATADVIAAPGRRTPAAGAGREGPRRPGVPHRPRRDQPVGGGRGRTVGHVALAARGIGVAPGGPFLVRPDTDHLRVTVGLIPDPDVRAVADHSPPTRRAPAVTPGVA